MMLTLVSKSIKNSFRNFRKIYLLLIISQFISVISIFFVYGIYTSYSVKMQEMDIDSYQIGTQFKKGEVGTLRECLPDILDQIERKLNYLWISAGGGRDMLSMYIEYHNGKYALADLVINNSQVKEGRTLAYEDEVNANRVIYSMNDKIGKLGDRVNIAGTEFEVIGVDQRQVGGLDIPFSSCPDNVGLFMVYFNFKQLPSQKDYDIIKTTLKGVFGDDVTIPEFQLKDQETIISYRTTMMISIAIGLVSAVSTCFLYGYIISQRQKQMAIYGIVGASKGLRLMMNELEIMLVDIAVVLVGFVVFRFGLQNRIIEIYESSMELYSTKAYLIMMALYVGCIFVFTTILLAVMNRDKLTDMLRRTKND